MLRDQAGHQPRRDCNEKVTLVGAGPVGSLLATFLARRGFEVEIYERRPDMRVEKISAGRSINLAMSVRGIHALQQVGAADLALAESVPMRGRLMHAVNGELSFQNYGSRESDCIYSISRGGLNQLLMTQAEKTGRVKIHFNQRVMRFNSDQSTLTIEDERAHERREIGVERVFGTDGSASAIRTETLRVTRGESSEDMLDYGYKELEMPADGSRHRMETHALHIWPRGSFMLIALPNFNGSFTCTLFLPMEGAVSFSRLTTREAVSAFFAEYFPDVVNQLPNYLDEYFSHPTGRMVTVRCSPWNIDARSLLLGDAGHAIVPFFGQGMNCGFEDCSIIAERLDRGESLDSVIRGFSPDRKPDTDAIADLAIENFVEMRDKVADPRFLLERQVERILQREYPDRYVSRYSMVSFSRVPYRQALKAGIAQGKLLARLCQDIRAADELDLGRAGRLLEELPKS